MLCVTVHIGRCLCCFKLASQNAARQNLRLPELFFRTCFLYLQYSAPSRLLLSSAALVFFLLLLQNSSFFRAGRRLLSSEPKAWLVSMRHAPPFIRFQGSPGSPGTGLILELYHGTIIPEILLSLSIYLDVLTGLMWTTTPRTINN